MMTLKPIPLLYVLLGLLFSCSTENLEPENVESPNQELGSNQFKSNPSQPLKISFPENQPEVWMFVLDVDAEGYVPDPLSGITPFKMSDGSEEEEWKSHLQEIWAFTNPEDSVFKCSLEVLGEDLSLSKLNELASIASDATREMNSKVDLITITVRMRRGGGR